MEQRFKMWMAVPVLTLAVAAAAGDAQTKPAAGHEGHDHHQAAAMPSEAEMMAKWMELATPGAPHKSFERAVGKWTTSTKVMMDPTKPPEMSTGSSEFSLLFGGRYLVQKYQGQVMGMPFEGMGIDGYDNVRRQFTSVWYDSMGTTPMFMTGNCDATGMSCVYHGTYDDAMTGEMAKIQKSKVTWKSADSMLFEMFQMIPGKDWAPMMEITYTRVK